MATPEAEMNHPELTQEDINDIKKEPGDVNDITQQMPTEDQQNQLRKLLAALPQEQAMQFLANLQKQQHDTGNHINPNNNIFSNSSKKEMMRSRLRQKIDQKKFSRMTKTAQTEKQEKVKQKHEELMKKHEELQKKHEETAHKCGDGCTDHQKQSDGTDSMKQPKVTEIKDITDVVD